MPHVFEPAASPSIEVAGSNKTFPVHRIYCVGQNYAAHSREMGGDPDRQPPFFFSKPADTAVPSGTDIPYPGRTVNLHHEIELVVALGKGGSNVAVEDAVSLIFGYAVGNDLTRRDLQSEAKAAGRPWDTAKGFDCSAPMTRISPIAETGELTAGRIWIKVNDSLRQEGDLSDMIWSVSEIIAELSTLFKLRPGDLIFTGTPAGVGPLKPGDRVEGGIDGLEVLSHRIT